MDGQRNKQDKLKPETGKKALSSHVKAGQSILNSSIQMSEILESISDGFYALDRNWRFTYLNKWVVSSTGMKAEELIGQNIWEMFPQFIGTDVELYFRKAMSESQFQEFESQSPINKRWFYSRVYPSKTGITTYWQDITERKQMQEALRQSQEKYRNLVESTSDFIWETNKDGIYTYVSPRIYEILGYKADEVIGKTPFDLMPSEEAERNLKLFQHFVSQRSAISSLENINCHKDGRLILLETSGVPFYDTEGNLQGYRGIDRDITQRKQKEEALKESEEKYRLLYETMSQGVIYHDAKGQIISANLAAQQILGVDLKQLQTGYPDHPHGIALHEDGTEFSEDQRPSSKALKTGRSIMNTVMGFFNQNDAAYRWVNVCAIPLFKPGESSPYQCYITLTDITERKKQQDELKNIIKERTGKLADANKQLKAYGQKITQVQEEERKRIAYELHDDTAQYLSILKMQIGALANSQKIQDPELIERLKYLEKDADRAFNDVRRYSHELRPVVLEHMGLRAALEQIAEDINNLNYLKVELDVEGSEPKLSEAVKLGFFRIAQEALNNVRKHSKADNAIIHLRFQSKLLNMTIIDNGIGFVMRQTGVKVGKKGSLGLMSMNERADLIGASLKIESRPGKGTVVRLEMAL